MLNLGGPDVGYLDWHVLYLEQVAQFTSRRLQMENHVCRGTINCFPIISKLEVGNNSNFSITLPTIWKYSCR